MPAITSLPLHARPREKLVEKGAQNLKDKELLAILLRTGRVGESALDIAARILRQFPISKLLELSYADLIKLKGINSGKACTILAAFELTRRATQQFDSFLPIISTPAAVADQVSNLVSLKKEHFVALYLNARNELLYKETISIGTLDNSLVHPREVFAPALAHRAAATVLAHNHPSGSLQPSAADLSLTKRLREAGEILGIEVVDHIIVSSQGCLSFRESDLW